MIIQRAKYKEKNIYYTKPVVKAKTNCKLQRWGCRQGAGLIGYFPYHWLSVEAWGQTSCVSAIQGKISRRLFTFLKHCVGHTQNIYGLDPTCWPPFCTFWIKTNWRSKQKWNSFTDYINYFLSFLGAVFQVYLFFDRYVPFYRKYSPPKCPQNILGSEETRGAR